jgi:hypothetical protein
MWFLPLVDAFQRFLVIARPGHRMESRTTAYRERIAVRRILP